MNPLYDRDNKPKAKPKNTGYRFEHYFYMDGVRVFVHSAYRRGEKIYRFMTKQDLGVISKSRKVDKDDLRKAFSVLDDGSAIPLKDALNRYNRRKSD